jgi:hypothetical protein
MPDENKFAKLREIGYQIRDCCGLCVFAGAFRGDWSACEFADNSYMHQTHANPAGGRGVSIHISGWCPNFKINPARRQSLGAHREFLLEPK